jgi:hypothetical protein
MTVVPFKPIRKRPEPPVRPPMALQSPPHSAASGPGEDDIDYRVRTRQNLAAFAVVILIVVLGTWLIERLQTYSRLQACIEAGHRNCLPLPIEQPRP